MMASTRCLRPHWSSMSLLKGSENVGGWEGPSDLADDEEDLKDVSIGSAFEIGAFSCNDPTTKGFFLGFNH